MMSTRFDFMAIAAIALFTASGPARAQTMEVPLTPDRWTATDSIKFETHLGRPSVYINSGVALARDVSLTDGTIEMDMASSPKNSNLGIGFHAASTRQLEVIYFRAGAGVVSDALQYGPVLNGVGAAWQLYHYDGANASANIPRPDWFHVKLKLSGETASLFLNEDTIPRLVVPRLAGTNGSGVAVWASAFGRGAWFSNIKCTPAPARAVSAAPTPPIGTITNWRLSEAIDAPSHTPGILPDLTNLSWDPVTIEPEGFVLINRWRAAPSITAPSDPKTGRPLTDSILGGRVRGSKVVFAWTLVRSDRDRLAPLNIMFSDEVVVYLNGRPLYAEVNPAGLRGDALGVMDKVGKTVYLPLKKGDNDLVVAVTEFFGGWAVGARLTP